MSFWAWFSIGFVVALVAVIAALPWVIRWLVLLLLFPRYRFVTLGRENVPRKGPAVLASNHISWLDGFLLAAASPRNGKVLVGATYVDIPILRELARHAGIIPVPWKGPKAQRAVIDAARAALDRGELLAIFPEGQISRNGFMGPFHRGFEVILSGRDEIPVIPVSLDNLWGSIFTRSGGRFFRKWPVGLRRTVVITFGPPVSPPPTAFKTKLAVQAACASSRSATRTAPPLPETIDLSLPHLEHPELGLLAASTADVDLPGIHQTGRKPGTVGQALPGRSLRAVDEAGSPLGPGKEGRLQARIAGRDSWVEIGRRGSLDREGFLTVTPAEPAVPVKDPTTKVESPASSADPEAARP